MTTPHIGVIYGGCNDLGYKNKEISTYDIVNAILGIGKLCQFRGLNSIFTSGLIYRKSIFRTIKLPWKITFEGLRVIH